MPDDDRMAITVSSLAGYGKPKRHTVSLPRITVLADDKRYATRPADPRQMRGPSPKNLDGLTELARHAARRRRLRREADERRKKKHKERSP